MSRRRSDGRRHLGRRGALPGRAVLSAAAAAPELAPEHGTGAPRRHTRTDRYRPFRGKLE